jgi:hypothetical protein
MGNPPMGIVAIGLIVGGSVGALGMVIADTATGNTPTFLLTIMIMALSLILTFWLIRFFNRIYLRSFKRGNR